MNTSKIKKLTKYFTDKKNEILASVNKASMQEDLDICGDEIDAAQGQVIFDIAEALNGRDKNTIKRIDIALRKIEKGTFGLCEDCGEPISEKRLMAIPDCSFCISCAEHIEAERKQFVR